MNALIEYDMKAINVKYCTLIMIMFLFMTVTLSCQRNQKSHENQKNILVAKESYIIMEKVLADAVDRPRTTMKILVPNTVKRESVDSALIQALDDVRHNDPVLISVIIWAYRTREELNASSYTVGKLEWSADGKDYAGKIQLKPNPKIHILVF